MGYLSSRVSTPITWLTGTHQLCCNLCSLSIEPYEFIWFWELGMGRKQMCYIGTELDPWLIKLSQCKITYWEVVVALSFWARSPSDCDFRKYNNTKRLIYSSHQPDTIPQINKNRLWNKRDITFINTNEIKFIFSCCPWKWTTCSFRAANTRSRMCRNTRFNELRSPMVGSNSLRFQECI